MNQTQVALLLRERAEEAGGQNRLAEQIGINEGYLSLILHGKRYPTRKVLAYLGLEIAYMPRQSAKPGSRPADFVRKEG